MFGNLSEYTTDELINLGARSMINAARGEGDMFKNREGRLTTEVALEVQRRRAIRNAWLDHCNAVAGEVIA